MDTNGILQKLQNELADLRKKRDEVVMEKGLVARDNNDLRENFAFEALEQKEHLISSKIRNLTMEIENYLKNVKNQ